MLCPWIILCLPLDFISLAVREGEKYAVGIVMPMVVGDNGGDNVGENTCDDEVTVGSHYMHAILFKGLKK